MSYFNEERNPNVKAKTLSAIPSVEIRGDELKGCTTVRLKEPLTGPEMQDLQDYLKGQFSDGWAKASSSRKSKPATVCCMYTLQKNALILKWNRCEVQKFPKNSLFPSALK